ncbi:MAG: stage sporulation protein [Thermoanaerobacter sp.]|jgi:stage III sporulation protein AH|uniref:SpoIIIAH-like family protein n=1 Tax=Desulfofundulus thermocisternus TaxID=42471 RepID=UPI0006924186|nr:SpoIIIAH-like family protein [Desulfofundulus thermocisternus]MDK2887563.1 stage sporulation protein [Thermoanaerobacter sp.]
MRTILIQKRTLLALLMGLLGLTLLVLGWHGAPEPFKRQDEGAPVSAGNITAEQGMADKTSPGSGPRVADASSRGTAFFVEYRLDRERTRGQQLELLREIINNPQAAPETRKTAQERLLVISQSLAREAEVENLLRARGFGDAAVSLDGRGATVVIQASSISAEEATRIAELVSRGTGVAEQDVVIIPVPGS